jgi:hypothetical protein
MGMDIASIIGMVRGVCMASTIGMNRENYMPVLWAFVDRAKVRMMSINRREYIISIMDIRQYVEHGVEFFSEYDKHG